MALISDAVTALVTLDIDYIAHAKILAQFNRPLRYA